MKYSSKRLSQTLTQLCLIKEIDHVVISPGSRNAPLIIGFTEHPGFKNFSIVDERCAAFFALGLAQQLKKPVALICTSGSALLNYYPAIAEAFYSDIPLVVISADRPEDLVEIGDGQTIRQEHVYSNHILYSANCKEGAQHQIYNETEINIALNTAIELSGPVHINAPFSEPLYETVDDLQVRPQHVPARIFRDTLPEDFETLKTIWDAEERKMVLVGVMDPNSIVPEVLDLLANDPAVLVFTETTSNLHHPNFFPAIDQLITSLSEAEFEELKPSVLLTFGGMVVSKRIKAFLRKFKPKYHWHINEKKAYDTYFSLSSHIKTSPNFFLKHMLGATTDSGSSYRDRWLDVKSIRLQKHDEFLGQAPFSDLFVYNTIFKTLPKNGNLQVANSAAIRYAQLFDFDPKTHVYCNRGTSGIDGSTSTAIGAAVAVSKKTVFVSGDLGFLYDSNALWNTYIPNDFRIILINNSGGGIFRILPGAKKAKDFSEFFETKHNLSALWLCKMFGIDYRSAESAAALDMELEGFYDSSDKPRLLEIFTPSETNDTVLMDYFRFIR
jgi:2-succinyl-5-enolpyruvyl-6-hydroxy-3-cyclohexene-1-carboxylate synthase